MLEVFYGSSSNTHCFLLFHLRLFKFGLLLGVSDQLFEKSAWYRRQWRRRGSGGGGQRLLLLFYLLINAVYGHSKSAVFTEGETNAHTADFSQNTCHNRRTSHVLKRYKLFPRLNQPKPRRVLVSLYLTKTPNTDMLVAPCTEVL